MTIVLARILAVLFGAIATLMLLLAIAAFSLGALDRVAVYLVIGVLAAFGVARTMRYERRKTGGGMPPGAAGPPRRTPRRPITFRVRETALTFAFWYAAAAAVDRVVTGSTDFFTLAAIAPFAAFMLTTLTIAGRHMAFRLTAEEDDAAG